MTSDDIIDGDFFRSLADIEIYENMPDKEVVTIYSPTCSYERAIMFIHQNPDRKFKLITHNSDRCVSKCFVPNNLIKWYAQNLDFKHEKLEPLPIGMENKQWHPNKREILDKYITRINKDRMETPLCQFNPATYPKERKSLYDMVMNGNVFADAFSCLNGKNFDIYTSNLVQYKFCLCPRGNGIDTHRLWESLLLGCIPIVKRYTTHEFNLPLPIIFIDDWKEVNKHFINKISTEIDYSLFNTPILTKEYWIKKICNT